MQRDAINIPFGRNLRAPTIATGWGVTNPRPTAFEAFGAATGEMMGQSDDLSDIAAHAPIVARVCGTWVGEARRVVPAGTVLVVKTVAAGPPDRPRPPTVTFSDDAGLMNRTSDVMPDDTVKKNTVDAIRLMRFGTTTTSVRFVVLANDLMDVKPHFTSNRTPAPTIVIATAVQSVAVVLAPKHQGELPIYPGDALYATITTDAGKIGKIELVASVRNTGPPVYTDDQWSLLGYVVVPPGRGDSHLHVSLVPHER